MRLYEEVGMRWWYGIFDEEFGREWRVRMRLEMGRNVMEGCRRWDITGMEGIWSYLDAGFGLASCS